MDSNSWSRTTKRIVVVSLFALLLVAVYLFRSVVPPAAVGFVLAYLLKPLVDGLQRHSGLPRTICILLIFIVLFLLIATIPATVVPVFVEQVARLNVDLQQVTADLVVLISQPINLMGYAVNLEDVVGDLQARIADLWQPFATQTVSLLFDIASSLLWTISILVIAFYLIRDAERIRGFLDTMAPPGYEEELRSLREEINYTWKSFFRGQLVLGLVVGTAVWLLMWIVGMPNAGMMGLLAGLLEAVPNFGPVIATIPALLMALLRGSTYLPISNVAFAVLVLGIYILVQQVENNFLVPRIIGSRLRLPPIIVFVGMLAGASLAGVLGLLLAAPVIATTRVVLRYVYAKLLDRKPFPMDTISDRVRELGPAKFDAILFDLDGTLIESDDTLVRSLAGRLAPISRVLPKRDPAAAARHLVMAVESPANGAVTLLDRLGLDRHVFALAERLRKRPGATKTASFEPMDGTRELLQQLSQRYALGIVTTRPGSEVRAFVEQQALTDVIRVITAREDTWRLKPHPSPILHTAKKLNVPPTRCLMVGDTTVDMIAARRAGAWAVGVLCGFGQTAELRRAGADVILDHTSHLARYLEAQFSGDGDKDEDELPAERVIG